MSTIAFVGCVKDKRPGVCAAGDKYTSALFTKSRAYALRHADGWRILSAKYGLLDPAAPIDDYDETLKDMNASARRSWAARVVEQIRAAQLLGPDDRILWLAGRDYKDHVEALLPQFEHLDPMRGLGIGSRLGWLTRELNKPTAPMPAPAPPTPIAPRAARPAPPLAQVGRGTKYDPLRLHLQRLGAPRVTLSFREIEQIIGDQLPESAIQYQAWWANQSGAGHSHAAAWQAAGYRVASVTLSRTAGMATFERR